MKTSLAATLSIVGVLASGAGAFAVNSYVLDNSTEVAYSAPVDTVADPAAVGIASTSAADGTASVAGQLTEDDDASTPGETTPPKTPTASPSTLPSSNTKLNTNQVNPTTTYNVGESGRVTLEVINGSLKVVSVAPNTGWTAQLPEYDDGEIEVEFYSGSTEVEFKARLVNGQISVFVESENESLDGRYEEDDDEHEDYEHEGERDDD